LDPLASERGPPVTAFPFCPPDDDTRSAQEGEDRAREERGLPESFARQYDLEMLRVEHFAKVLAVVQDSLF
jgi:hypothetical protein